MGSWGSPIQHTLHRALQVFCELVKGLGESLVSGMVPGSSIAFAARKDNLEHPETLSYASKSEGMFVRESLIFRCGTDKGKWLRFLSVCIVGAPLLVMLLLTAVVKSAGAAMMCRSHQTFASALTHASRCCWCTHGLSLNLISVRAWAKLLEATCFTNNNIPCSPAATTHNSTHYPNLFFAGLTATARTWRAMLARACTSPSPWTRRSWCALTTTTTPSPRTPTSGARCEMQHVM